MQTQAGRVLDPALFAAFRDWLASSGHDDG
jgi:hypothetical protein